MGRERSRRGDQGVIKGWGMGRGRGREWGEGEGGNGEREREGMIGEWGRGGRPRDREWES